MPDCCSKRWPAVRLCGMMLRQRAKGRIAAESARHHNTTRSVRRMNVAVLLLTSDDVLLEASWRWRFRTELSTSSTKGTRLDRSRRSQPGRSTPKLASYSALSYARGICSRSRCACSCWSGLSSSMVCPAPGKATRPSSGQPGASGPTSRPIVSQPRRRLRFRPNNSRRRVPRQSFRSSGRALAVC